MTSTPSVHPETIVHVLRCRAAQQPNDLAYRFLEEGEGPGVTVTYGQLDSRARAVAAFLQARYPAGERVLLVFPPGLDYIAALFGCFYAGVIAVPAHPQSPSKLERGDGRLSAIATDCQPAAALAPANLVTSHAERQGDTVLG